MRVLFYVEPHPIRNSEIHFNDVVRKFLPLLDAGPKMDMRLFANNKTLEAVGAATLEPYTKRLIRSTLEEETLFKSYLLDWGSEGVPIWLDLMAGRGDVSEDYLNILRRIWRTFPFEVIVHWGENGAITRFTEERPVTRIAMELGCTRSPFFESVVMDPFGTNGSAVTPRLSVADLRDIVGGQQMSRHQAIMAYSQNLETLTYEHQFLPLPGDLASEALKAKRLAFLPLQLYDDANLLRFSPYNKVSDVVLDVISKLAEQGYTTIIKPHPASRHRQNAHMANFIARSELQQWADKVIWCDRTDVTYNNSQLINLCDFVITVNSSVGFEALYYDKPVVVLGDAVYKPRDLFPSLEQILEGNFDYDTYLQGAGYLRQFFLGGYLQSDKIRSDASMFAERLGLIDYLCKLRPTDPIHFARGFYAASAPAQQSSARSAMFYGLSTPGQNEFAIPGQAQRKNRSQTAITSAYLPIARRLLSYTRIQELDEVLEWLDLTWRSEKGLTEIIMEGGLVDDTYYLKTYADVREANIDPIFHFVHYGLQEGRSPRASISGAKAEETLTLLKEAITAAIVQPVIPLYPLSPEEAVRRDSQFAEIRAALEHSQKRIAVVAHLYYRDLVPEILSALETIPEAFDLIVTLPDWGTRHIEQMVREAYPEAVFYRAVNRGRDIGPFVDLLPLITEKNYDALLKIQTKRGYYRSGRLLPQFGQLWRSETFRALLGNKSRVTDILEALRTDPSLNMVGPSPYFLSLTKYPYHDQGDLAQTILNNPTGNGFFAGTMFWVRPSCLRPLTEPEHLSITAFEPESGANDGATAHLIERLFSQVAFANDGKIAGVPSDPELPLEFDLAPCRMEIHDYFKKRIEEQSENSQKGALAW
ncbi:rhamnan synthesis F family protein [Cellvibrio japonicus]|uniref:Capsule polysaccharide biosynthesis protein family n=1 Tax=Cellvibrio japonicus (strain Ueda107) TaxID=498211 RepID=B3PFZ1_CELJU|nr:rhamnan synthesis F family protein [Cellvibrio japonicus]ACE83829.1 Capsule polysaccharide biosynthesis protein family [Cellvibrio japonicus Ueda107]QEI13680.1 hypothetical protein FY117_16645 [Cellvibrio japonicus]QEI17254.1 hypothetical protein FY116_16650 [Cellvibrio japonicus]QEI20831.1 hypothetical protein FY115_16645 [Cellvibrio japonicus]